MKSAIVFRSTSDYFYNVGNMIVNIERFSPEFCGDYVIYTDDITDVNWQSLEEIGKYYNKRIYIKSYTKEYFYSRTKLEIPKSGFFSMYPQLIFSLFEIFDLLNEYDDVLALDVDMFVSEKIDEIKEMGPLAFRNARKLNDQLSEPLFAENSITPNAGCVYVTRALQDYESMTDRCYELLVKYFGKIKNTYEETVLGILVQEYNITYKIMPEVYNKAAGYIDSSFATIVHCLATNKPWQNKEILACFPEIVRSVNKFNEITKNKYKNIKIEYALLDEKIKRVFLANYWDLLYSKIADMIPECYILNKNDKQYLQLYIHGVPRYIHYELLIKYDRWRHTIRDNFIDISKRNGIDSILVQLHVEKKDLVHIFRNEMDFVVKKIDMNIETHASDNALSLYINSSIDDFESNMKTFFDVTYKEIVKGLLINKYWGSAIPKWLETARVDIKNKGNGNDVKITVLEGGDCNITHPSWFAKEGTGYVLETRDKRLVLELSCVGSGILIINLGGVDRKSPDGNRLPLWVDYTRFEIDGEVVFWEVKPQWHDGAYRFSRRVSDGETIKVEISWSPHGYKGDELASLLSMCVVQQA